MVTLRVRFWVGAVVLLAIGVTACGTTTATTQQPLAPDSQQSSTATASAPSQTPPPEPTDAAAPGPTTVAERTRDEPPVPDPTPTPTENDWDTEIAEFEPIPVSGTIDSVDFLNGFTYAPWWGEPVTVTDGTVTIGAYGDEEFFDFVVVDVAYGDLDGDALDEAAVTTAFNTGGSGFFSSVAAYQVVDGQLELVGETYGGDRADGGVYDAYITNGLLTVETFATDLGACCPNMLNQTRWGLGDKTLIPIEWLPSVAWMSLESYGDVQELLFRPDTTSAILAVYGHETEGRFTFSAQGGQLLELDTIAGPTPLTIVVTDVASGEVVAASETEAYVELPTTGIYGVELEFGEGDRDGDRTTLRVSITSPTSGPVLTLSTRFEHNILSVDPHASTLVRWPAFETRSSDVDTEATNAEIESFAYELLDTWLDDEAIDDLLLRTDATAQSQFDLSFDVSLISQDLVSVHFDYYEYMCCRPYPNIGQRAVTIDLSTGRRLELGELIDLARIDEIQDLWLDVLEREDEYLSDLDEFSSAGLVQYLAVSLTPTGIEFGTDRGMLGGAAQGPTSTVVTFEELGSLVNADIAARAASGIAPISLIPEVCGC